jgi:hypothetical protein
MQNAATQRVIDVLDTVVVIAASDISKSREWYSRLPGKSPDLEPFPGNVEFNLGLCPQPEDALEDHEDERRDIGRETDTG